MSNNVIDKQIVLSIINQLSFKNVSNFINSSRKLIEMMESLIRNFECDDFELKKAFENVHFKYFEVIELNELRFTKYLASFDKIGLDGFGLNGNVTTTVRDIRKKINEINELGECKRVRIVGYELQDEKSDDDDITKCSKLKYLYIGGCNVNKNSFNNLCKWAIASSVEEFILGGIGDMKVEWWKVLLDAIMNAKEKNDGDLALKKLEIERCPCMNDEMKEKIQQCGIILDTDDADDDDDGNAMHPIQIEIRSTPLQAHSMDVSPPQSVRYCQVHLRKAKTGNLLQNRNHQVHFYKSIARMVLLNQRDTKHTITGQSHKCLFSARKTLSFQICEDLKATQKNSYT